MAAEMTGGCRCGRFRYAARIAGDEAYLCRCGMGRRGDRRMAAIGRLPNK